MSVPRADLGQGRDRGLPQVPSDKPTWSLSGGLNGGTEQLPQPGQARINQNPEPPDWDSGAENGGARQPQLLVWVTLGPGKGWAQDRVGREAVAGAGMEGSKGWTGCGCV